MAFECSICWENMYGSGIVSTQCGHLFHNECLKLWMKRSITPEVTKCPTCNLKLAKNTATSRMASPSKLTIEVKLPREVKRKKKDASSGLFKAFPEDALFVTAAESHIRIATREQLALRHSNLEKAYKKLNEVYDSRLLQSRTLDAVTISLAEEKKRLIEKLSKAKAQSTKTRKRKENSDEMAEPENKRRRQ